MTRRKIRMEQYEWSVICFLSYTINDTDYICRALKDIRCNGDALLEAYGHLSKNCSGRGLTYSNVIERKSIVAIGKSPDRASILNTIGHELFHVVAHICNKDNIDMQGEEPCYIMGELCEKLYKCL